MAQPYTIGGINMLPEDQKHNIYCDLIPREIIERFKIPRSFTDPSGHSLIQAKWSPGIPSVELALYHQADFPDPVLYGQLADTITGQIHVLLYILNDPESPRFDVDRMPDGRPTKFGTSERNLEAEKAALEAGLAPGQVRRGLRLLGSAIIAFENFVETLGHDLFFIEPLYYHNAVIFERYGFAYQQGRKLMERIQAGFLPGGDLLKRLDNSSFRLAHAENSIRLRSWAIHDGLLGEPFTNVTMYKRIGKHAGFSTVADTKW
jgi:acetoin utilization protein AcuC